MARKFFYILLKHHDDDDLSEKAGLLLVRGLSQMGKNVFSN